MAMVMGSQALPLYPLRQADIISFESVSTGIFRNPLKCNMASGLSHGAFNLPIQAVTSKDLRRLPSLLTSHKHLL